MNIFEAVQSGKLEDVQSLLAADKNLKEAEDSVGCRPLHFAAARGEMGILRLLLGHKAKVNSRNKQKQTPLHFALEARQGEAARALVAAGADVALIHNPKGSCLFGWLQMGNEAAVQFFLELGGDPNHVAISYGRRRTALHVLAEAEHKELKMDARVRLTRLLLKHGADPNAPDHEQGTPLHVAAQHGQWQMMEVLLDGGADIEAKEKEGATPLFYAVASADLLAVEFLLKRGAKANVKAKDGKTALDYAKDYFGYRYITQTIAGRGQKGPVQMSKVQPGEFLCACKKGYIDVAKRLLREDPNAIHTRGSVGTIDTASPLHLAATYDQPEIARLLLENGHPADAVDEYSGTPLKHAVQSSNVEVVRVLLEGGAQVNVKDHQQSTALHEAAYPLPGKVKIVELLLAAGADPKARDSDNKTPLDHAKRYVGDPNHAEHQAELQKVIALLSARSAK